MTPRAAAIRIITAPSSESPPMAPNGTSSSVPSSGAAGSCSADAHTSRSCRKTAASPSTSPPAPVGKPAGISACPTGPPTARPSVLAAVGAGARVYGRAWMGPTEPLASPTTTHVSTSSCSRSSASIDATARDGNGAATDPASPGGGKASRVNSGPGKANDAAAEPMVGSASRSARPMRAGLPVGPFGRLLGRPAPPSATPPSPPPEARK
mmetsp:Transcript_12921/g.42277  ORF Transcript_12921/g.42277 Transcript_12921/m.42277 type:complete len:210 (-) Transcript_12921:595-1224(-)